MIVGPDFVNSISENNIDISSAWIFTDVDAYSYDYKEVMLQPISSEAVSLTYLKFKVPVTNIVIRSGPAANDPILFAGTSFNIPDTEETSNYHNDLGGLQGGSVGEYYHLSATQYNLLTSGGNTTLHSHSFDRNRSNHTGTQLASTISNFTSATRVLFSGSAPIVYSSATGAFSHSTTGTAGTYTKVVTNATGHVTSGSVLTSADIPNLDASKITTGTFDIARIPALPADNVIITTAFSALTSGQQAGIVAGTTVLLSTDGRSFKYSGTGDKTLEGSYIYISDQTPDWSIIANRPTNVSTWSNDAGYLTNTTGDARYSLTSHLHTGQYLPLSGGTLTGPLSQNGIATWQGLVGYESAVSVIYGGGVTPTTQNYGLAVQKDGTYTTINGTTGAMMAVNNTAILTVTSASVSITKPTIFTSRGTQAGYTIWDAGNLTDLNQLTNGPGYVTSAVGGTIYAPLTHLHTGQYLPLSGGTLTGNLSGTTASFSGNVQVGTYVYSKGSDGTTYTTPGFVGDWNSAYTWGIVGGNGALNDNTIGFRTLNASKTAIGYANIAAGSAAFNGATMPAWGASLNPIMLGGESFLYSYKANYGTQPTLGSNFYYDGTNLKVIGTYANSNYPRALVFENNGTLSYNISTTSPVAGTTITDLTTKFSVSKEGNGTFAGTISEGGTLLSTKYSSSSHLHTGQYLPLSGGTLTGDLYIGNNYIRSGASGDATIWNDGSNFRFGSAGVSRGMYFQDSSTNVLYWTSGGNPTFTRTLVGTNASFTGPVTSNSVLVSQQTQSGNVAGNGARLGLIDPGTTSKGWIVQHGQTDDKLQFFHQDNGVWTEKAYLTSAGSFIANGTIWEGGTSLASKYLGITAAASSSNFLNKNATFKYSGESGIQYYDGDMTSVGTSANYNGFQGPTSAWYQVIHMPLSVGNYFNELLFPVNDTAGLWWRQRRNASYYGWFKILDSQNYMTYALPLSGGTLTGPLTGTTAAFSGSATFHNSIQKPWVTNFYPIGLGGECGTYNYNGIALSLYGNCYSDNGSSWKWFNTASNTRYARILQLESNGTLVYYTSVTSPTADTTITDMSVKFSVSKEGNGSFSNSVFAPTISGTNTYGGKGLVKSAAIGFGAFFGTVDTGTMATTVGIIIDETSTQTYHSQKAGGNHSFYINGTQTASIDAGGINGVGNLSIANIGNGGIRLYGETVTGNGIVSLSPILKYGFSTVIANTGYVRFPVSIQGAIVVINGKSYGAPITSTKATVQSGVIYPKGSGTVTTIDCDERRMFIGNGTDWFEV